MAGNVSQNNGQDDIGYGAFGMCMQFVMYTNGVWSIYIYTWEYKTPLISLSRLFIFWFLFC
jgi:hypothetical protein